MHHIAHARCPTFDSALGALRLGTAERLIIPSNLHTVL
jgi:hypothetical protein